MHLVIGAGEFLGDNVSRALAVEVPVIAVHADSDDETLVDAISGVEVIINCAQTWSPARRLRYRRAAPSLLRRMLDAARRAGVRRIVHVSTADVYGPDHFARINERTKLKPVHAYERLKLNEEKWLVNAAGDDVEVVVVRPARIFGVGEDWMVPRLMGSVVRGRVWLPGGGHAPQTFIAATDVGRACLAASDRARPGQSYLVGGFDSNWRSLVESAGRAVGMPHVSPGDGRGSDHAVRSSGLARCLHSRRHGEAALLRRFVVAPRAHVVAVGRKLRAGDAADGILAREPARRRGRCFGCRRSCLAARQLAHNYVERSPR